jgi:putative drug exporter of the RND superfamily
VNAALDRLGRWCARRHWLVLVVWLVLLVATLLANRAWGGTFVNDFSVPGSQSDTGLSVLQERFPQAGGYAGQIVFSSDHGTVADQQAAVSSSMAAVAKLPDVLTATDPFAAPGSPLVSQSGTVAYGPVSWTVIPASLGSDYRDRLDAAVAPARAAG